LFIGLDGATFTVLDTLTGSDPRRGIVMPNLRRMMEQGARGFLRSTINPLTPPAWVSLMTGRSPGAHGVYDFLRAEERDEDVFFTLTDARDVQVETIWSVASRNQRTIVALNFPITAPPRPVNGFMVPGFVPWKHLRRNVTPPELFDRLKALPGFDAKELAWDFDREVQAMHELDRGGIEEWLSYHVDREGQWFRIAEALLRDEEPDLMASCSTAPTRSSTRRGNISRRNTIGAIRLRARKRSSSCAGAISPSSTISSASWCGTRDPKLRCSSPRITALPVRRKSCG